MYLPQYYTKHIRPAVPALFDLSLIDGLGARPDVSLCEDCVSKSPVEDNGIHHQGFTEFTWQRCLNPTVGNSNLPEGFFLWLSNGCRSLENTIVVDCHLYEEEQNE